MDVIRVSTAQSFRRRWAGIAMGLLLWESVRLLGLASPIIFAAPSDIVRAAYADWPQFVQALQVTCINILIAVAVAWTLGVGLGLLVGAGRLSFAAFNPILSSLFAIPLIVWYPMLVVWIGIGPESKIVYGIITGALPIALNTAAGVRMIDPRYVVFGRSIGASAGNIYLTIMLPFALPAIVSGLRIGTALTVSSVIVGEMLASTDGLGYLITYHRALYNTGHVYLGILIAIGCVLVIARLLSMLEVRLGGWRHE